jgi:hypothetical protein
VKGMETLLASASSVRLPFGSSMLSDIARDAAAPACMHTTYYSFAHKKMRAELVWPLKKLAHQGRE